LSADRQAAAQGDATYRAVLPVAQPAALPVHEEAVPFGGLVTSIFETVGFTRPKAVDFRRLRSPRRVARGWPLWGLRATLQAAQSAGAPRWPARAPPRVGPASASRCRPRTANASSHPESWRLVPNSLV